MGISLDQCPVLLLNEVFAFVLVGRVLRKPSRSNGIEDCIDGVVEAWEVVVGFHGLVVPWDAEGGCGEEGEEEDEVLD